MIKFINEHKDIGNKEKALIALSTRFLLKELIPNEDVKLLIKWGSMTNNTQASVVVDHTKDNQFVISLGEHNSTNYNMLYRALAHELIHVKQFVTGQLSTPFKNMPFVSCWKQTSSCKPQFFHNTDKISHADYMALPWEQEAHSNTNALFLELYKHLLQKQRENFLVRHYNSFFGKDEFEDKNKLKDDYSISVGSLKSVYQLADLF